jgi:hypothetical protein
VVAPLALAPAASSIRHDSACRPAGFAGTDSPDDWMLADQLSSFNCVGEMHPTAGGVWPDDHDWSWVPVPAGSTATFSVTICPTLVFVAGWNPDLSLSFLPAAGLVPATTPYVGQAAQYASPALSQVAAPLPIGASANASGCDAVLGASPPAGLDPGGGRYYVDVHRAAGGGAYTLVASLP